VALRCVYTDLDGTLLGRDGSLFRDGEGAFTLLPARALEACFRAGVEVVIKSGRREAQVMEDARLIGQTAYIYEVGAGLVIDGERMLLTGDWQPRDGESIHAQIERSGAPALLLDRFSGRLEYHSPWHADREISHLFRGTIDAADANATLAEAGLDSLRLVDNGAIAPRPQFEGRPHAFHLIPAVTSKANAVAAHMRARGYSPQECIAVGDSDEDADVGRVVGRFVRVSEPATGFYEAVIETLAQRDISR
jgi:phosphoglycolate phosphatase